MDKKQAFVLLAFAAMLCGCGNDSKKVDGGYFCEIPSLLISQVEDKEELRHKAKTEMESEDDFIKLQSEANKKEEEYKKKLEKAYGEMKNINVRHAIENDSYDMSTPPTMEVKWSSSESSWVDINFTLKAKNDITTDKTSAYSSTRKLTVYCKFIDNENKVVRKECQSIFKIDGKELGETVVAGTLLPCKVSFRMEVEKEESGGETSFSVPDAAIDKIVVITKDEYDTL